eukprot:1562709-Alexandrium_andersonii.AAC.1
MCIRDRLAPPARAASPGGATAPPHPPIGASGAPETPVGGARGAVASLVRLLAPEAPVGGIRGGGSLPGSGGVRTGGSTPREGQAQFFWSRGISGAGHAKGRLQ